MDITKFVVSSRDQALLYGDYSTYQKQLAKKLQNCRKKLNIATKNRGKFSHKGEVNAAQINENHDYLFLLILTAERAWANAMSMKAHHSADNKGITGHTRKHIISRLDKGARTAENAVELLEDTAVSNATSTDILEAKAYAALIRGATQFEKHDWESCVKSYSTARIIYSALGSSAKLDIYKDLLSETIDPSIRYAAYQSKVPRTMAIPNIARRAFPSSDTALVEQINKLDPNVLKQGEADANKGTASGGPQTINWRSREVKIEDAAIAVALAATDAATAQLSQKLSQSSTLLPKERAAAYDEVLIASQDAADATKQAIDELRGEGVPQSDPRMQSLQITRTAVNYRMISWRIGRNRVLSGEHDGAILDSAPNTTRKAKKDAEAERPKEEPTGRKIARLREKVVLYDATLQSLDSIKELPGIAADDGLLTQLDATYKYFHALKCLSIARSHSLSGNPVNALALIKYASDECQESGNVFDNGDSSMDGLPKNIDVDPTDFKFLQNLLKGELQRSRAIVEIHNLRESRNTGDSKAAPPLVERLHEYPTKPVDLDNLVAYPPKIEPIPVRPLFFDVAFNYIDYPRKQPADGAKATGKTEAPAAASQPQKRGWFGFGRS